MAQGKGNISPVRETVKEILRIYEAQDWSKLRDNQITRKARAAQNTVMRNNKSDPLSHIYLALLDILGTSLPSVILHDNDEEFPADMANLDQMVVRTKYNKRFAIDIFKPVDKLIEKYPTIKVRTPVELAELKKIADLLQNVKNALEVFYATKLATIDVRKTALRAAMRLGARTAPATSTTLSYRPAGGRKSVTRKNKRSVSKSRRTRK